MLSFSLIKLNGNTRKGDLIYNALQILKVLLEQGDPFQAKYISIYRIRFLISGFLLVGLVVSNAFKSTNVYNIVLPRFSMLYEQFEDLLSDNFQIYSRVWVFYYKFQSRTTYYSTDPQMFMKSFKDGWELYGSAEFHEKFRYDKNLTPTRKIVYDHTKIHPAIMKMFLESMDSLQTLTNAGMLKRTNGKPIASGFVLKEYMREKQQNYIENNLKTCNKTAWLLPNYKASIIYNKLRKAGKHLDIGKTAYTKTHIGLIIDGIGSLHLVKRISLISATGLLEWWPNFLNKSYNMLAKEVLPPTKPRMSGNIQVILIILRIGLSLASACILIECRKNIFQIAITVFLTMYAYTKRFFQCLLGWCKAVS